MGLQQSLRATEHQHALFGAPPRPQMPDLLHSLSHAAVSLQNQFRHPGQAGALAGLTEAAAVAHATNANNNPPPPGLPNGLPNNSNSNNGNNNNNNNNNSNDN